MLPEPPVTDPPCSNAVGVDTHSDIHAVCVTDPTGRILHQAVYPATPRGYQQLQQEVEEHGPCAYAIECTSTYGHGLVSHLLSAGADVYQAVRPNKKMRRGGKTDMVDAHAAALSLLTGKTLPRPRSTQEALTDLRFRMVARHSAVKSAAETLNQLRCLLVISPPELREELRTLPEGKLLLTCSRWRPRVGDHQRQTLKSLAVRVSTLRAEARHHEVALTLLVDLLAPQLRYQLGVGAVSAATLLLVAGDHPERLRSADSFAALCGTTPIAACSGKTQKWRLNRGGDRQANCALHRIVLTRVRFDPGTRAYLDRCMARGKSRRDAVRLLKTYVARDLYKVIKAGTLS